MMDRSVKTLAMAAGVATMLLGLGGSHQATAGEECRVLLQNKCSTCHFVRYICPKLATNSGTIYWTWVMRTMVKEGAVLTDQEKSRLVDCLSAGDAQARSFCAEKK